MNSLISFKLILICTIVLAAQQSQARKTCDTYGYACYGGHGKRSLGSSMGGGGASVSGSKQDDIRPNAILQVFPNEVPTSIDGELETYPRYRLIKIIKSWFNGHSRRPTENDFPLSAESLSRDNAFN